MTLTSFFSQPFTSVAATQVRRSSRASPDDAPGSSTYPLSDVYAHNRPNAGLVSPATPTSQRPRQLPIASFASNYHASFLLPLFIVVNALCWPWIMFGYVHHKGGVPASQSLATYVQANPQYIHFLTTLTGTFFSTLTTFLFSTAIIRFSQKWFPSREEVDMFHISFFVALRYKLFPWGWKDLPTLIRKWRLVIILVASIIAFTFIPSGISALLAPVLIHKSVNVNGTELDIASSDPQCTQWLRNQTVNGPSCGWFTLGGFNYTSCFDENQSVDTLESGRNNIVLLQNGTTQSQFFNQLGGIQFSTPIPGVLPIGPGGVPGFDILSPLLPSAVARSSSYNYTLDLQGIDSDITCQYAPQTLVNFTTQSPGIFQVEGVCPTGTDVLGPTNYISIPSTHTLGFWACASDSSRQSYNLYLSGYDAYNTSIANITCSLSMKAAAYSVTFFSQPGIFVTSQSSTQQPPTSLPTFFIEDLIKNLGGLVPESQTFTDNLMAESVITLGGKLFNLPVDQMDDMYLRLFEAMLKGIFWYQATYSRFIYSAYNTILPAPSSCMRAIYGNSTVEVIGWHYDKHTAPILLPPTFINLAAFILLLCAMSMGDKVIYARDPTDLKSFLLSPTEGVETTGRANVDIEGKNLYARVSERKSSAGLEGGYTSDLEEVPHV